MIVRDANSTEVNLDGRGAAVLSLIIREHIITGEPVGSRIVSERCAQSKGWSSATIRNCMAELEEADLVEQPHTSAGRVPTDKGYRYFVDHLIGADARLSQGDLDAIEEFVAAALRPEQSSGGNRLMEKVSHLLSQLSDNVGIVVAPALGDNLLQHIEFLPLADDRALVVMIFAPNVIQHKIVRLDEPMTQAELERTARYLNHEFSGKSLLTIRAEILALLREEKALYDQLIRHAALLCERSLEGEEAMTGDVFIDGASNILIKPDFSDVRRLSELLRTLEEKSRLVEILNECLKRERPLAHMSDVYVAIGRENATPVMQNCTLITASYRVGATEALGTLGVVSPMRIEYARMMALVNYVARIVERTLCDETTVRTN